MIPFLPHATENDAVIATIEAMRSQEETAYKCSDYFAMYQDDPPTHGPCGPLDVPPADAECRFKMSEWCYQVVDFCRFSRETVEISMNLFDRYLMTPPGQRTLGDRKVFQLTSMTCLYTAIKIFEPEAMEPKIIANLSQGAYTTEEVEAVEREILLGLGFRLSPPTSMAFVHHFLALLPDGSIDEDLHFEIIELIKVQVEQAIKYYEFTRVNNSTIAHAALSNAFYCSDMPQCLKTEFLQIIAALVDIDTKSQLYIVVLEKLFGILVHVPLLDCGVSSDWSVRGMSKSSNRLGTVFNSPRSIMGLL